MSKYLLVFLLLVYSFQQTKCLYEINVGAIFDDDDIDKQIAFNLAIDLINEQGLLANYKLVGVSESIKPDNPYLAAQTACNLMSQGVVAILGPSSEENANGVQSVCDAKDIPYIETRLHEQEQNKTSLVNFYPFPGRLRKVFVDVVKKFEWKQLTILYEDYEGLSRISELLKPYGNESYNIVLKQLDKQQSGNYRPVLKEVWRSEQKYFILDCSIEHLPDILQQAQQIGLLTNIYCFIITNLDLHTVDISPYQYAETEIFGFKIINPDDPKVQLVAAKLEEMRKDLGQEFETFPNVAAWKLRLDTALIIDAVTFLAHALSELESVSDFDMQKLDCDSAENWKHGLSIISYMKTNAVDGLTGYISFNQQGFRSDFSLKVVQLMEGGIVDVGNWNSTNNDAINITKIDPKRNVEMVLANANFTIITTILQPYAMWRENKTPLFGNKRLEGFGVDLIEELSNSLGFNYTFIIRDDGDNGGRIKGTEDDWSGMIGDVRKGVADLAIADLTVTSEREQAVDFTSPFMNLGISILFRKPEKAQPNFFSFAEPFAVEVWLMLGAAYFGVSISLFILGRLSPSEWDNPFPCIEEPEFLINQLSLRNSFWFTIGSLMQQGTEIELLGISTRMVAGMWWFFILIMVSSYTANLAAFLTNENSDTLFTNVKELAERAEYLGIKVGAKKGGATLKHLEKTDEYKNIYKLIQKNADEVLVDKNEIGVKMAEDEKYAFFMESVSIEYEIQRHCRLTQIGGLLDEKHYAIAMRKDFPFRTSLTSAMLKLQEGGVIQDLKRKWWESRRGGGRCDSAEESNEGAALNLKNVGGVFWVSFAGIMLACVFVFIEMLLHVAKESIKNRASFRSELAEEIKFFFKFKGMVKPVRNKSKSKSPEESNKSLDNGYIIDNIPIEITDG